MDLTLTDEQRLFAEGLSRLLARHHAFERRRERVAAGDWGDATLWAALAELGAFGVAVPEESGGFGGGAIEIGLALRAAGRHLLIEPITSAVIAGTLLGGTLDGDDHVAALIGGEARLAPLFDLGPDGGSRRSVRGGAGAAFALLASDSELRIVDMADVPSSPVPLLDDTVALDMDIPADAGRALRLRNDWSRHLAGARANDKLARCWQALGTIDGAVEATTAYVRERRQFGRPLSAFQTVQHRIAEMIVAANEAEVAALLGALTLDAEGPGPAATRALAVALHRCAMAGRIVAETAVQLHGGMGVSDELDIAARFRHLEAFRLSVAAEDRPVDTYRTVAMSEGAHRQSAVLRAA